MGELFRCLCATAIAALPVSVPVLAKSSYVEPSLKIASANSAVSAVALTLDACGGQVDNRIISTLVSHTIPVTVFVSARWIRRNAKTMALFKAHPELFEIENHGRDHRPAIDKAGSVFGVRNAGSTEAVRVEVDGGSAAIVVATGKKPKWFRGATALYSASSLKFIEAMGLRIAGFSISADAGASLSAAATEKRMAGAADGDVILAHVNQPGRGAGAGVVKGILALKARGFRFVKLEDVKTR